MFLLVSLFFQKRQIFRSKWQLTVITNRAFINILNFAIVNKVPNRDKNQYTH